MDTAPAWLLHPPQPPPWAPLAAPRSPRGLWARLRSALAQGWRLLRQREEGDREDAELVRDALKARSKGRPDGHAYEELVRRHQAWLLRLLTSLLHNQADAEDVAQEVFVRAFLALDTYRGDASFRSWLRTIATRTAFNWKRGRKTASRYEHAASEHRAVVDSRTAAPPSGAVVARETLTSLLEASPYPYKEILVLRYLEELSLNEIAETLNISLSAAKMRLKRARDDFETRYAALE